CGLTSLDIEQIRSHILGTVCMTDNWQLIAADADENGTISTLDLVLIQKVILDYPHTMRSWRFVPSAQYGLFDPPASYPCSQPPAFTPYIDILEIEDNHTHQDLVGIKTGDVNGTCTDCSGDSFTGAEEISIVVTDQGRGRWDIAFDRTFEDLSVWYLELELPPADGRESKLIHHLRDAWLSYRIERTLLRILYFTMLPGGERLAAHMPFLTIYTAESHRGAPALATSQRREVVTDADRV